VDTGRSLQSVAVVPTHSSTVTSIAYCHRHRAVLSCAYDGAIIPPKDLRSGNSYVRLVQKLIDRGHSDDVIRKLLGANFLRAFEKLRP
jgi:microsomal dipeptidase-like Zn-dependent dipeptidase